MVTESPQVAQAAYRLLWWFLEAGVVDLTRIRVFGEFGQDLIDVVVGVADPLKGILGAELLEQLCKRRLVPLCELVGSVVRDRVGRGVQIGALEPVDGNLLVLQLCRGLEPRVARDDLA